MELTSELKFLLTLSPEEMCDLRAICNLVFNGPYGRGVPDATIVSAKKLDDILKDQLKSRGYDT